MKTLIPVKFSCLSSFRASDYITIGRNFAIENDIPFIPQVRQVSKPHKSNRSPNTRKNNKNTCSSLLVELFNPDSNGFSRVVSKTELVGKYSPLFSRNGSTWSRNDSHISKKYNILKIRLNNDGQRSRIVAYKLNGFRKDDNGFTQTIRSDIKNHFKNKNVAYAVVLIIFASITETEEKTIQT